MYAGFKVASHLIRPLIITLVFLCILVSHIHLHQVISLVGLTQCCCVFRYNLLFFVSGGGKFNYQGTKRWLEDNLDHTGTRQQNKSAPNPQPPLLNKNHKTKQNQVSLPNG